MKEIDALELKARLASGEAIEVLDIRETAEYESWHIAGSRNLPVYDALRARNDTVLVEGSAGLPRDRPIVAVCRSGVISQRATQVLGALGFDTFSLSGGIRGWGRVWTEAPISLASASGAACIQIRRNGKGCLSYVFGTNGEAAVVDPSVETRAYTEIAGRHAWKITRVFETHVHADHLSRARALCAETGASLHMPPNGRVTFDYAPIADGESLSVGGIRVEAIATPGHTAESTCYLLDGQVLLTGDTLFVENVGRPDLEKGDAGADAGARMLYHSLRERILGTFREVRIYPCHHASPIGFDGAPIGAPLDEIRGRLDVTRVTENEFASRIVASLGVKPPNHESIIAVNEGKADLGGRDPLDLEAGPNRCAAS